MELMTEIVKGIVDWVKTLIKVKSIVASTNKSNDASFKVLEKIISLKLERQQLYLGSVTK